SSYPQIFVIIGNDFNCAEVAVCFKVCRPVGKRVLAAQLLLDFGKCVRPAAHLKWKKCSPPGGVGNALQYSVARALGSTDVSADRVHDHRSPLRHLNGLLASYMTVSVVA